MGALMARKSILTADTGVRKPADRPADGKMIPRAAVGALQSSLAKLQENAVQELDAALIDDAGYEDRLGHDGEADRMLLESLRTYGQQVPVLVRPHPEKTGRYEIVYGRRRMKALRALGVPVKAMIRQLDDHALVMAQGQENTSRQDLSFIEKASFAAQLQEAGYERQTIADALSTDLPMLSRLLKAGGAFALPVLRSIGSAPGIGRDRWLALAKLCADEPAKQRAEAALNAADFTEKNSDQRFEAVFTAASRQQEAPARAQGDDARPRTLRSGSGDVLGDIRRSRRGVALTLATRGGAGFADWFEQNAEELISDLHHRWSAQNNTDQK